MTNSRKDLGRVVITLAVHDGSENNLRELGATLHEGPTDDAGLERVIVLMPKRLHEMLGWPADRPPRVVLMGMDERATRREILLTHPDRTF